MLRTLMATAAVSFLASTAYGQWTQEPKSLLGIRFGVPLSEQLPECDRDTSLVGMARRGELSGDQKLDQQMVEDWEKLPSYKTDQQTECYHLPFRESAMIENPPDLGLAGAAVEVVVINGLVEGVRMGLPRSERSKMIELLIAKFGPPHAREKVTYSNLAGAVRVGSVLRWAGRRVTIEFSEYGGSVDESSVSAFTTVVGRIHRQESRRNAAVNKNKL